MHQKGKTGGEATVRVRSPGAVFQVSNTQFVHNLRGNTQIMRNVRQVTKSVNPEGLATWSLTKIYDRLCEYLYEIYDTVEHPALGEESEGSVFSGWPIRVSASTE